MGNQFTREDDAKNDFGWSNSSNDYSDNEIAHDNNELVEDMFEANEGFLGKIWGHCTAPFRMFTWYMEYIQNSHIHLYFSFVRSR